MIFGNPPTDNLYKFISIAGVAIFAIAMYGPMVLLKDFVAQEHAIKYEIALADAEIKYSETRSLGDSARLSEHDAAIKIASIAAKKEQIKDLLKEYDVYIIISIALLITSAIMIVPGFLFWFFKVQRYEDRILIAKTEKDGENK